MFRRVFYLILLTVFAATGALSAFLLHKHALAWWACADAWGMCFAEGNNPLDRAAPMGIPVAYGAITLVATILALKSLWGVLRPARNRYA